jgi:acyl carrier protein
MTRDETIEAIRTVLRDHMNNKHLGAFHPGARLNSDLYLDSVLLLQLFLNLELEFGLTAPEEAIAAVDLDTVADVAALFCEAPADRAVETPVAADTGLGVHGEDYVDLKIHCFVSCLCAGLKERGIDHRPFYFGVWDADFGVDERFRLLYHAPSVSHEPFRLWFQRLYGAEIRAWYDHAAGKEENLRTLVGLLGRRRPSEQVMVMLDMFHLPERENKFNQNPFPHYLMLETTDDPDVWQVLDPDFRWEGKIARSTVVNAIMQPTVGGGYVFDRADMRVPHPADLDAWFAACFKPDINPLNSALRAIVEAHLGGEGVLAHADLEGALRELPVISIRKYAYEHGFAFFWRALKLPDAEFQRWCDEIEALALGYKALHYAAMKLARTGSAADRDEVLADLDRLDLLELRIKGRLGEVHALWRVREGLGHSGGLRRAG